LQRFKTVGHEIGGVIGGHIAHGMGSSVGIVGQHITNELYVDVFLTDRVAFAIDQVT